MEGRVAGEGHEKNTTLQKKVLIKKQRLKKNTIFIWRLKGAQNLGPSKKRRKKGSNEKKTHQKMGIKKSARNNVKSRQILFCFFKLGEA
jgi:hypothetical protein